MAIKITLAVNEEYHTRKDFLVACVEGRSRDAAVIAQAGVSARTFMAGISRLCDQGAEDILQYCR